MQYLLDNLPLDMIQFEIFPYLDYDSRVTANAMLPPVDRIQYRLKKDAAIQFALTYSSMKIYSYLKKMDIATGIQRRRCVLKIYREIPKHFHILEYSEKARVEILKKSAEFSDTNGDDYRESTTHMKKTLPKLCRVILDMAMKRPFIRLVETSGRDGWSAISCKEPMHIVDNDALVRALSGKEGRWTRSQIIQSTGVGITIMQRH
jgi:hypothetical protein